MRVISGKFKGRKLGSPSDERVRPTTDRIKETLFNILSSKNPDGYGLVLDLFGGSGAVGIESISRGADKVIFIDRDPDSVKLIKDNLNHVGAKSEEYEVYNVDYEFALKKLRGKKFDFIFADPPYALGLERKIAELIKKHDLLSDKGVLCVEHSSDKKVKFDGYDEDKRECGYTVLSFLTYKKEEQNEQ